MSHLKLSSKEIELFVLSMKSYQRQLNRAHPHSDTYKYLHPVAKEKRYLEATIGKMENELKVRSMRPHKVTT